MTRLKLFLENDGKSYPLKPNREYIVGSGSDCDLKLDDVNVASQHLKFSFNQFTNTWHVSDLGSSSGTVIDNHWITNDYPITKPTRIAVANSIFLVATPEGSEAAVIQQQTIPAPPAPYPPPPPLPRTPSSQVPSTSHSSEQVRVSTPTGIATIRQETVEIEKLTWNQYVEKQVKKQKNWLARIATDFHLSTGLRNASWTRLNNEGSGLDFGFDGYVIPNFLEKGSVKEVGRTIVNNIAQLRQYENTDCFIAELADEHLINSAKETILQRLFSFRFFPIRRGGDGEFDYRKFIVVSYNQIRTYLIVEGYGTDLFVSWVTRYEPNITPGIVYWLVTTIVLSLLLLSSKNFVIFTIPICIWALVYLLLPQLMKILRILPKRANAYLFIFILVIQYIGAVAYGLSKLEATSGDLITSIGLSVGIFFIVVIAFVIGTLGAFLYIGIIAAAIWAMEKVTANTNISSRR